MRSIHQSQLLKLTDSFRRDHTLFAPVKKGQSDYIFAENPDSAEIVFHYPLTILPPKKVFLPPEELLSSGGNVETDNYPSLPEADDKTLLFAVHLCDIHGILYLDKAMGSPFVDEWYRRRRENTIIIGIADLKQSRYLSETFAPDIYGGFDLFLEPIDDLNFLAIPGSNYGEKMIQSRFFQETDFHPGKVTPRPAIAKKDSDYLAKVIKETMNSKIWDELAKKCIACGICSYVCPVCYCTDTLDLFDLSDNSCQRCRNWGACMLPEFAKMAGDIDPRPTLKERYRNWYYHKFVRSTKEYGQPGCIGCGRCVHYCPAKINFMEVLAQLEQEYASKARNGRMSRTSKTSNNQDGIQRA